MLLDRLRCNYIKFPDYCNVSYFSSIYRVLVYLQIRCTGTPWQSEHEKSRGQVAGCRYKNGDSARGRLERGVRPTESESERQGDRHGGRK